MGVRGIGALLSAITAIALTANLPPALILRTHVLDSYQLLNGLDGNLGPLADPPLVIVDLDDESQRRLGQWPWPRARMGELLSHLNQAGAKVAAFDILFAEPDRIGPDQDGTFAQTMNLLPVVLAQSVAPKSLEDFNQEPRGLPTRANLLGVGDDWHSFVQSWPGMVRNIPKLEGRGGRFRLYFDCPGK